MNYKENTVISKKEAVDVFGSVDQKNHFNKYGRFNNKKIENALIKTLNEFYEKVEKIKVGRGYSFKIGSLRSEKAEREDNRSNSHLMSDFTQSLDMFIVSTLEHNGGSIGNEDKTMSDWMVDFGLSNEKLNQAFKSVKNGSYHAQIQELKESEIIEDGQEMVFFDYMRFHQNLKENLEKSVARMQKAKIVELVDHHYMCVDRYEIRDFFDSESGTVQSEAVKTDSNDFVSIDPTLYSKLKTTERNLKVKYNIKIDQYGKSKKTKKEKEAFSKYAKERDQAFYDIFKSLNTYIMDSNERLVVKFMFVRKEIILTAMPNRIIRYLEKYQGNNPELEEIKSIYKSADPYESHLAAFEKFSKERRLHLEERAKKAEESLEKWIEERSTGYDSVDDNGVRIDYRERLSTCEENGKYNKLKVQKMYAPVIMHMDSNYRKDEKDDILASLVLQ